MNKKIKTVLIVVFTTCFLTESAWADFIKFERVSCIPELNYFEISAFDFTSDSKQENDVIIYKPKDLEKYGLLNGNDYLCKLNEGVIKVEVDRYDPEESGLYFCKGEPPSILKIWVDNLLVVHLKHFNDCEVGDVYSTKSINIKLAEKGKLLKIGFDVQDNNRPRPLSFNLYKKDLRWEVEKSKKDFSPITGNKIFEYLNNNKN